MILKSSIFVWLAVEIVFAYLAIIAAMSETGWVAIVAGIPLIITAAGTVYIGVMQARAKIVSEAALAEIQRKQEEVSLNQEQVRRTAVKTQTKLDGLAKVTTATYHLSNGALTTQLQQNAELSRWKSDQTHDPVDIKLADDREAALADHIRKQALIDKTVNEVVGDELHKEVHKEIDETPGAKVPPIVASNGAKHTNPEE